MLDFLIELITTPAVMLGLVALVGLLIQRKNAADVTKGTLKTILGVLILSAGSGVIVQYLEPFATIFTQGFQLTGVVPFDEAVVGALSEKVPEIARNGSLILAFGFVINIILARFSPFKYIFLTGHMLWIMSGALAWAFYDLGYQTVEAVLWGSMIQGLACVLFPALAQPIMRKLTGSGDIGYGHFTTAGVVLSAGIGKLAGNPQKSTEQMKMPKSLEFFKDTAVSISCVMVLIYLISVLMAGPEFMKSISNDQNWIVFAIVQGLGFTAGVLILLQGVRMFLGEIVPAFRGVAQKLVPGATPALDCPVVFAFAPNALIIGFLSSIVGMVIGMLVSQSFGAIVPLPSIIGGFFTGGIAGIFGNTWGGRRGAMISGLIYGLVLTIPVALFFPMYGLEAYGVTGIALLVSDALIVLSGVKLLHSLHLLPIVVPAVIVALIVWGIVRNGRNKGAELKQ
ncbi:MULTISPECIES: PTS ascorbate transporter subunit IIC [unclassified Paenibacillus]|uniref:PTS ascorbate transporter subunit IIC n=1 Tax=unclassified Paenibacillus TaxID=185978 RepID=UPI001C11634C|nr:MULTISPECIES: PTS ascorbate transporter subunit IIC [unclassified Paenibacillus]MBU5440748.1 PTS ascorbate transporter subunit IIC [Paenibacillus sp. MSJ-34]CAH0120396.1 Ascorbate-specific PTS system EIIC component [Paenibacillus sp. CECT 9249]